MPRPSCPRCDERQCVRRKRAGLFQILIAPHLGLFPWHCSVCRKVFLVKERGKSKNKNKAKFADYINTTWKARVDSDSLDNTQEFHESENRGATNPDPAPHPTHPERIARPQS